MNRDRQWLLEDHSHDPWSKLARESKADACLVSLRKTVPIPDGGVLWSPVGRNLPTTPAPTEMHFGASAEKLSAMALKARYLAGGCVEKGEFRKLFLSGEAAIGRGEVSGMSAYTRGVLKHFPAVQWREARRRNYEALRQQLSGISEIEVLTPQDGDAVPFSTVVLFESKYIRDKVRAHLNGDCIYTAVLWPMENPAADGVRAEDIDFAERMLSLHCDGRYDATDMARVAESVTDILSRNGSSPSTVKSDDAVPSLR